MSKIDDVISMAKEIGDEDSVKLLETAKNELPSDVLENADRISEQFGEFIEKLNAAVDNVFEILQDKKYSESKDILKFNFILSTSYAGKSAQEAVVGDSDSLERNILKILKKII